MSRAVSAVVGVAILVGVTVVALGALTASVGTVVDTQTHRADASRVADAFDRVGAGTGPGTGRLAVASGRLETVDRDLRVLRNGRVVEHVTVDALVYESGRRAVVYLGGAVIRQNGGSVWFVREPRITAGDEGTVVAGAVALEESVTAQGTFEARLGASANRTARSVDGGQVGIAVETATPEPWVDYLTEHGATVHRADIDGDGRVSVVGTFDAEAGRVLVRRLEVSLRG